MFACCWLGYHFVTELNSNEQIFLFCFLSFGRWLRLICVLFFSLFPLSFVGTSSFLTNLQIFLCFYNAIVCCVSVIKFLSVALRSSSNVIPQNSFIPSFLHSHNGTNCQKGRDDEPPVEAGCARNAKQLFLLASGTVLNQFCSVSRCWWKTNIRIWDLV